MIRVDLMCSDGTCIGVNGIVSLKEQIGVFIPESRRYRDIITFEKEVASIDNLWDLKYKIVDKTIDHIIVYGTRIDPQTNETIEIVIEELEKVSYVFHGVYREIFEKENGTTFNSIFLTIVSNRGPMKENDPKDDALAKTEINDKEVTK